MEYITNYNQPEELINSLSIEIETYLHDKVHYTEFFLNTGGWVEIDEIISWKKTTLFSQSFQEYQDYKLNFQ